MRRIITKEQLLDMNDMADLRAVLKEYLDTHTYQDGKDETFLTIKRIYDFMIDNNGATEMIISHSTNYSMGVEN